MFSDLANLSSDLHQPAHRALAEHWLDLYYAEGRRIPALQAIDPLRLGRFLPDICILDHEADDGFRFRLAGETVIELYGCDIRRRLLDEVVPQPSLDRYRALAHTILEQPAGLLHGLSGMLPAWNYSIALERLSLPLAGHDGRLRHIISATVLSRPGDAVSGEFQHLYAIPQRRPADDSAGDGLPLRMQSPPPAP